MWIPYLTEKELRITSFYSAFEDKNDQNFVFTGERHDFWEVVYIIDGSAIVSADERIIRLTKNRIIFHKPNEFHTIRSDQAGGYHAFIFSFDVQGSFMKQYENKTFCLTSTQKEDLMDILGFIRAIIREQTEKGITVPQLYFTESRTYSHILKNRLENFFLTLSDATSSEQLLEDTKASIYRHAVNYIDRHLEENILITSVAEHCNVSASYLKRIFYGYTGLGIHQYVLQSKLLTAKKMLLEGMRVTEVANCLSFSSQSHFSTVFRQREGMSPSDYKNSILSKNINGKSI